MERKEVAEEKASIRGTSLARGERGVPCRKGDRWSLRCCCPILPALSPYCDYGHSTLFASHDTEHFDRGYDKKFQAVLRLFKSSERGHRSSHFITPSSFSCSPSVPDSVSQCQSHYPRRSFDERPAAAARSLPARLLPRLHHLPLSLVRPLRRRAGLGSVPITQHMRNADQIEEGSKRKGGKREGALQNTSKGSISN